MKTKIILFLLLLSVKTSFSQTLIVPTFDAVEPICSGNALSELPTTSINGITGSWNPALSNTETREYTFIPNEGQNASNATLTITVNPRITPTFDEVGIFENSSISFALPTTSTNGIEGSWSPSTIQEGQNTYTFTPNAQQCGNTATITLYFIKLNTAPPPSNYQRSSKKPKIIAKKNPNIYPNPSSNNFNIDLTNSSENYKCIEIYNLLGNLIYKGNLTKSLNTIELSNVPAGQYFGHLINGEKSSVVKLIKI